MASNMWLKYMWFGVLLAARVMAEAEAFEPAAGADAPSTCSVALGLAIVVHVLDCEYSC